MLDISMRRTKDVSTDADCVVGQRFVGWIS